MNRDTLINFQAMNTQFLRQDSPGNVAVHSALDQPYKVGLATGVTGPRLSQARCTWSSCRPHSQRGHQPWCNPLLPNSDPALPRAHRTTVLPGMASPWDRTACRLRAWVWPSHGAAVLLPELGTQERPNESVGQDRGRPELQPMPTSF